LAPALISVALLLLGSLLAFTMHPDRKFVDKPAMDVAPVRLGSTG
jgi:hypothetical protein